MSSNLFRKEVFDAKKHRWTGNIILSRPLTFTFLTICSVLIALTIISFTIWGKYTKRSTVQGQLVPKSGLIQIYTSQQGTILEKNVYEGKYVEKGDILFIVSTSTYGEQGSVALALTRETQAKQQSIKNEIIRMIAIHQNEKDGTLNQINQLEESILKLNRSINNQKNRLNISSINQERYKKALAENAVSSEEFDLTKIDLINQIAEYESLQREKINIQKQLNEQKIVLNGLQHRQKNETEQLERLLLTNNQEFIEIQAQQKIVIQAHSSGVVSTINAEIGQFVDFSKPLITILPKDAPLIAQLYVPSRAIGFVKRGDQVLLRYQAYPYQKFGHAKAQILSVAKTASASQDLKTIGTISPEIQVNNEPVYLVRAQLQQQTIKAYGNNMPLQVGMTLEGDILHDTRRLYEWVLEPLFSITGKL